MAETQVRRIEIRVNGTGIDSLKSISKGFKEVNTSIRQTNQVVSNFRNAFLAIQGLSFAGLGVREIVQATDAIQKFGDRLLITEGSAIGAAARLRDLTNVANTNFTSIEDTGIIYNRLSQALNDVGISSQEVVVLTDRLQKTFRLSGSTAAEATAATIQLSQGLASGQIRGQELRSVLEANVVVGKLLSEQLGLTRGELLKFAEKQGGISAVDFLNALAKGAEDLDRNASKLRPTIQEALTRNFNELKVTLNALNKEFLLTEKAIVGIDLVFKNLDLIAAGLGIAALAKAAGFLYTQFILVSSAISLFVTKAIGSTFVGVIVKAATFVGGLVTAFVSLPVAIVGAVTAFVLAFSTIDEFREKVIDTIVAVKDFIAITLKTSLMTEETKKKFYEYKEAAEAYEQITLEMNKSSGIFVLQQSELEKQFIATTKAMQEGTALLGPIEKQFAKLGESTFQAKKGAFDYKIELGLLNEKISLNKITLEEYNKALKELKIKQLNIDLVQGSSEWEEYNKKLKEIEFGKLKNNVKSFQFDLRELNKEFGKNADISKYSDALSKIEIKRLSNDYKDGRTNLTDFNSGLNAERVEQYNREIAKGRITFGQYVDAINRVNFDELNNQFKSGKMNAAEFYDSLNKIEGKFSFSGSLLSGVNNYVQSAGTLATNVSNVVTQTFNRLEDSLVQFTQTGKFVFRDFAKAVIEDINRIIIRALIIRPIAQGILGSIGGTDAAGGTTSYSADYLAGDTGGFAKGGAFNRGVREFAQGGVFNSTTPFTYGRGQLGVLGEAGPEAILPLKRDGQGNLGVKAAPSNVVVNVINQSGAETEQRESTGPDGTRIIDIIIINKVKEGFAAGAFDKQLSTQYNIRRRGI